MSESIWEDPRITNYALGEMPDQERLEFENEMASNSELAAAVEEAQTVTDQLSSLYGDETIPLLESKRRESIVATPVTSPAQNSALPWSRITWVVACAAALLLILGVASAFRARVQQQQVAQSSMRTMEMPLPAATELRGVTDDQRRYQKERAKLAPEPVAGPVRLYSATSGLEISPDQSQVQVRGLLSSSDEEGESAPVTGGVQTDKFAAQPFSFYSDVQRASEIAAIEAIPQSDSGAEPRQNVEFVPEGGTVVLRGSTRSKAVIEELVEQLEAPDAKIRALSVAPPSATTEYRLMQEQKLDGLDAAKSLSKQSPTQNFSEATVDYSQPQAAEAKAHAGKGLTRIASGFSRASQPGQGVAVLSGGTALRFERTLGRPGTDFGLPIDEGRGPGISGDQFEPITDNPFRRVSEHPLSTFSVDVDTASYSKVRDYLARANQLPRPDAVRIEELVNYFNYGYEPPDDSAEHPFAARVSVTSCPWNEEHRLARIALKGKTMEPEERPRCNLVFLLDTSGSMNSPNKLALVIEGMQMLLTQLNDDDRVAITVYAGSAGLVLDSTAAKKGKKINKALTRLSAGGSTNGGAGIALAYQTARDHFITDGVNRVILCTDGDFNVGTTGTDELVRMVENEAKGGVFLSVLGFGMGNHNDSMLEQISGRGNGNYAFIDGRQEARKVLVEQTSSTLVTIAKDVKLQIDFNINKVSSYRLIGYENRILAKEDFNDDKKDAGEIGAGHTVTALYEIVPAGIEADAVPPKTDGSKYQLPPQPSEAADSDQLITVKLRYKEPDGDTSKLVEFPVVDDGQQFKDADEDVRFAAAVASFGMQLRRSPYAGSWTLSDAMNTANRAKGEDREGLRAEFVTLVQKASELMGEE